MKDWRENGIMVPYGFVLWALRDAITHPSDAAYVLDEFLREEFDSFGKVFCSEVLMILDIWTNSALPDHSIVAKEIRKQRKEIWFKLNWDLRKRMDHESE